MTNPSFTGPAGFKFTAFNRALLALVGAAALSGAPWARAFVIVPTFDTTITSDTNASTIESSINQAIQVYETDLANPITVDITFNEMNTGLGQSNTTITSVDYASYLSALTANATSAVDATALASLPNTVNNPVDGQSSLNITAANAVALGLISFSGTAGTISLNTSLMNLSRAATNPSLFDLESVTMHEIDEVLGTASGIGSGAISPADLFRYNSTGQRSFSATASSAFFSLNGTTLLARYNQDPTGDFGDWFSPGGQTPQVQDAFATGGAAPNPGVELTVLDAVGFNVSTVPEPAATAMILGGVIALWAARRRHARRAK